MSWIKLSEVHKCDLPEYEHLAHNVGELWRCDEGFCNRVWRLYHINAYPDGAGGWVGEYKFSLIDINELHSWR